MHLSRLAPQNLRLLACILTRISLPDSPRARVLCADVSNLPVDHALPRKLGSTTLDARTFTAVLTRVTPQPANISVPIIYSGNGAYKVQLLAPSLGTFLLTIVLRRQVPRDLRHVAPPGQQPVGSARSIVVRCPEFQRELAPGSLLCGVTPGYTMSETDEPILCQAGHYKSWVGNEPCTQCHPGEYAPSHGATRCDNCSAGSASGVAATSCDLCEAPTSAASGASSCSICTASYYLENASRPASVANCKPCLSGFVHGCPAGTSIASVTLDAGFWRHSTATGQVKRCGQSGSWSPCHGGSSAGIDGDGYCAEGYRGPRCELCDGPAYSKFFDKLHAS